MVQHNRASGADRRIYGRSAVHLERGRRHRVRRQRKTNRWAGHDCVDLQCVDPIAWRQMHHWGLAKDFVQIKPRKGVQVLTLRVSTKGHMNFAYLDFKPEPK